MSETPGSKCMVFSFLQSSESRKSAGAHSTAVSDFLCVTHDCGFLSHQVKRVSKYIVYLVVYMSG